MDHMTIKTFAMAAAVAAASSFSLQSAAAVPLTVIDVGAPAVNCVFHTTCSVVVDDSVGTFNLPGDTGDGRLQSRTYPGTAPAPAAGDMAYVYRVDMTGMHGLTAVNCVTKMVLDFGHVVPLPYSPKGDFDVFVVTSGGLGTVGLSSALQSGNAIEFNFTKPVCPGETSYFFGLASKSLKPVTNKAELFRSLGGTVITEARIP
jgi:hypothetical protein